MVTLAILLLPVILKKQLAEFKWLGTLMIASVAIFVIAGVHILMSHLPPVEVEQTKSAYRTFTSILTTIVAYSYQTSVFPVYNALQERTPKSYARVQTIGLLTTLGVYLVVAMIGMLSFGAAVRSSVLLNYGELRTADGEPMRATLVI